MSLSPEELSRLIDAHWGALIAWVGAAQDAEDVVQQAFVSLAGLVEAPDNPRAWLYKTAKNKAINAHKSSKRRLARQQLASKPERTAMPENSTAEISELQALLENLSQEQREIVVAKVWGQLTFDEIASIHGSSKATVWRIYNTAIELLRSLYGVTYEATK